MKKIFIAITLAAAAIYFLYPVAAKAIKPKFGKITCSHNARYYIAMGFYDSIDNVFYPNGTQTKIYLLGSNCMVELYEDYVQ
jgi:hypothetical protein